MNDYARARGKAAVDAAPPPISTPRRPLRQLSQSEQEIIARRRALVHEHMPELVPEIKALADLGMIDGWRNIQRFEVLETGEVA